MERMFHETKLEVFERYKSARNKKSNKFYTFSTPSCNNKPEGIEDIDSLFSQCKEEVI